MSASIVAARLLDLREELGRLRSAGVDGIHVDIEDGVFVPAMGLGLNALDAVAEWGGLPIDVHLMVSDPERVLALMGDVPVDAVAVHLESTPYPRRVLAMVRESGRRAGLALNPATPVPELGVLTDHLDYLLMLTTEPEISDPAFLEGRLPAIRELAEGSGIPVIVDGGVTPDLAPRIAEAGASGVVVGRALFGEGDPADAVRRIQGRVA
ncbi:MAG: ribulose-phosphate 3-epimerase [Microbacteriaceae bacterium]|nr:ribulose-phosphate 3-epimerase [Microbacteriaceae bacterium]